MNNYYKFIDATLVKNRFALLIAKLHDAGLLLDYINEVIVKSKFFDCFENNDLNEFMNSSFELITKNVFGKEVVYDYSHDLTNAYYWAGLAVMEIMMNLEIPLKRILLIMPLKEIVSHFQLFHEMHPEQFIELYSNVEKTTSLFKILKNEENISTSRISYLTGIKQSLLNIFDKSNDTLFATSFSNLSKLSKLFDVSIDIFKKKSSYIPFSLSLLGNSEFKEIFAVNILRYFNMKQIDNYLVSSKYIEDKEVRSLLLNNKAIVDMSGPFGVLNISSNRVNRKYLNNEEFAFLYKKSIDELKLRISGLVF